MEERGLFPGRIKLVSEGLTPKKLVMLGEEKSSISLFSTIPVLVISFEPKYVLIVLREEKWEWGEIQRVREDPGRCVCVCGGEEGVGEQEEWLCASTQESSLVSMPHTRAWE